MHMAEELTGYFRRRRPGLPALALADPGHLTCVANDAGFEQVFARGVQALGKPEDIFVGLSTSGESLNLVRAFAGSQTARAENALFSWKRWRCTFTSGRFGVSGRRALALRSHSGGPYDSDSLDHRVV